MKRQNQKLYLAQMVAAICVVLIHVGTVVKDPVLHFVIKSLICRVAVPFFFVNNAYFFRVNSQEEGYSKEWMKRILINYTKVFVLYVPFGIQLVRETVNMPWKLTPILIVVSYLYSGSFYHLWYFPAMIFALFFVSGLIMKIGYKGTLLISSVLFMIGSIETYSSFVNSQLLENLMKHYFSLFFTTRNGLFFSPIFVLIGFFLADNQRLLARWRPHFKIGLLIAVCLGVIEGILVYQNQGIDKNFMYFTILLNLCYFGLLVTSESNWHGLDRLKSYSQGIFLLHMIPIQIFNSWNPTNTPLNGLIRACLGIVVPSVVIFIFNLSKQRILRNKFKQNMKLN